MSSPLIFDRPWALLLLPLVLFALWAAARRSRAGLAPASRRLAFGLRAIVITLLVLAVAGAHLVRRSNTLTTLFLLDVSRSIRPDQRAHALEYIRKALAAKGRDDQAGIIVFGRTPTLEDAPSDTLQELGNIHASVAGDATDLSEALRLAEGAFPAGTGRKIVLLSDGNENVGTALSEMDSLRAGGIQTDVAPTALGGSAGGAASSEALVDSVALPTQIRAAAPFEVRVVVSSTVSQKAQLSLQRDGQALTHQSVMLKAGKNIFTFTERETPPGFHRYDAVLNPTADGISENNQAFGVITVLDRPRVLYVSDPKEPPDPNLQKAMTAQGISLVTRAPGAVPVTVSELASYDAVTLSDVPADELTPAQMTALAEASQEFGVGLGMSGGENSFGAGHYQGTPLETALPVTMDVHSQRVLPSAAIVVVLDASGSMGATEDGVQKVQLGARAAVHLMGALQPDDQVAVTAVTETSTIVVPLQPASKAGAARTAIESVHAGGGGIFCRQGLSDAYALLIGSHASIKHVILCADTQDSEQQEECVAMAQDMLHRYHISTTVCGIGRPGDQHVPFQRAVANAGGGQLFVVNQAGDLPRLFERDVRTIQRSWFVEKPTLPRSDPTDTVLNGIAFGSAPPLLGYDLTTAKPGATVALSAPGQNDPIFAYWRYGLGRTFAFTSDDRAHWATQWLPWPGYGRFWAQALRWSLRSNTGVDFQTTVDNDDGKGHLVVDAYAQNGGFVNKAPLTARVVAPDLTAKSVTLTQTAAGRYEGTFDADQTGAYMINVRQGSAGANVGAATPSQTVGFVVPYSPEYRTLGPNLPLLTQLIEATGGKIQTDPMRVFKDSTVWTVGVQDLLPALLLLTALLFLADITVRRLALRPAAVRETTIRGAEAVGARLAAVRDAASIQAAPLTEAQTRPLLNRNVSERARVVDDRQTPIPDSLLSRRAVSGANADDPFPQVASLYGKPAAKPPAPPDDDYAARIQDAARRGQHRED